MFLKISQNSQKNLLCQSVFFNKVAGWRLSYEFCEIFKKTFFSEHLWTSSVISDQKHIQNLVKYLRWSFLRKQLTIVIRWVRLSHKNRTNRIKGCFSMMRTVLISEGQFNTSCNAKNNFWFYLIRLWEFCIASYHNKSIYPELVCFR